MKVSFPLSHQLSHAHMVAGGCAEFRCGYVLVGRILGKFLQFLLLVGSTESELHTRLSWLLRSHILPRVR